MQFLRTRLCILKYAFGVQILDQSNGPHLTILFKHKSVQVWWDVLSPSHTKNQKESQQSQYAMYIVHLQQPINSHLCMYHIQPQILRLQREILGSPQTKESRNSSVSTHPFWQTNTHVLRIQQKSSGFNEKFLVHHTPKKVETQACRVREKFLHSTTGSSQNQQVQLNNCWLGTEATFDTDNSPMMFQKKAQWCYWNIVQKGIEWHIWRMHLQTLILILDWMNNLTSNMHLKPSYRFPVQVRRWWQLSIWGCFFRGRPLKTVNLK